MIIVGFCILGASLVQSVNLLLLVFAVLIGMVLLSWRYSKRNVKHLTARRFLPNECFAGTQASVGIEVQRTRNRSPVWSLEVHDKVEVEGGSNFSPRVAFPLFHSETATGRYKLSLNHRGHYQFSALDIKSRFPMGAVEATFTAPSPDRLLVFPALGRLAPDWYQHVAGPGSQLASRAPDHGGNDFDFHSLREFRSGDNLKHVHWRTTARRQQLMVKEYEPFETQDTLIVVDPWLPADATAEQRSLFETMVSFVATCCVELCRWPGNRLALAVAGEHESFDDGQTSPQHGRALLGRLALLQPDTMGNVLECYENLPLGRNRSLIRWIVSCRELPNVQRNLSTGPSSSGLRVINVSGNDLYELFTV